MHYDSKCIKYRFISPKNVLQVSPLEHNSRLHHCTHLPIKLLNYNLHKCTRSCYRTQVPNHLRSSCIVHKYPFQQGIRHSLSTSLPTTTSGSQSDFEQMPRAVSVTILAAEFCAAVDQRSRLESFSLSLYLCNVR